MVGQLKKYATNQKHLNLRKKLKRLRITTNYAKQMSDSECYYESDEERPAAKNVNFMTTSPNFKCTKCNKQFYFNDSQIIRCCFCGYRILYKIRTQNYITYVSD